MLQQQSGLGVREACLSLEQRRQWLEHVVALEYLSHDIEHLALVLLLILHKSLELYLVCLHHMVLELKNMHMPTLEEESEDIGHHE